MVELAIIADDLTGSLDAAAPFAVRGIETVVALTPGAVASALDQKPRVLSVSTDSREVDPQAAAAAVRVALAGLPPGTPIFKKVDSRLKGNIAAELDAIPHRQSLVVPAIPAFGRLVRNGHVVGFGVAEPIAIAGRLARHAAAAHIPGIASQTDIELSLAKPHDLVIGARGVAEAMALRMAPQASAAPVSIPEASAYCVIGSIDPITLAQVELLRQTHPDMLAIAAPNGVAPAVAGWAALTLLQATSGATRATGIEVATALAASLTRLAPPADALLVLSGGATAQVILQSLGLGVMTLLGEALPGLPIARAGGLTVVTKSGGFGEPDCLSRLFASHASARSPVQSHVG